VLFAERAASLRQKSEELESLINRVEKNLTERIDDVKEIRVRLNNHELLFMPRKEAEDNYKSIKELVDRSTIFINTELEKSTRSQEILRDQDIKRAAGVAEKLEETVHRTASELDKRISEKFLSSKEAAEQASYVMDGRLEGMNEFRNQINSERVEYVRKEELATKLEALKEQFQDFRTFRDQKLGERGYARDAAQRAEVRSQRSFNAMHNLLVGLAIVVSTIISVGTAVYLHTR
jgi:hypothetical protein